MITGPVKRNQFEVAHRLSRDCSAEIDLNTSQHSDVEDYSMLDGALVNDAEMSSKEGGEVGSEPTNVSEDCSNRWSNKCENTRALVRIRSHMNCESNKRKRWRGRIDETDRLPDPSFSKSETGINPLENKYEIALALKELVSRGMVAEAVNEISTMDPDFFTQNPVLHFHLKQVTKESSLRETACIFFFFCSVVGDTKIIHIIYMYYAQVEFLKLVSAGDHNGALKVACSHLGPLAANDQSLLKTLKETLVVLLQPDGNTTGKDLPLNDLANTLQVTTVFISFKSLLLAFV